MTFRRSRSDARVFVCRQSEDRQSAIVEEEAGNFANEPVDNILVSDVFDGTQPFSKEISELLIQRKDAIEADDMEERDKVEKLLLEKNPSYFSYFNVDKRLREIYGGRE